MFAFVFESVGSGEWLVLLAVVLIVVGPKNLPAAARKMGQIMSKLRRAADEFKRQLMTMDEEMKRTADEIKRDYIDIPEDGAGHTDTGAPEEETPSDDPGYDYAAYSDDPDHMGDYPGPEGYPEDDDVTGDEAGLDGAAAESPAGDPPAAGSAAAPEAGATPETPETTNGQDTRNTEESGRGQ